MFGRILLSLVVLLALGLILEHSTHHLDDGSACEICLLVSTLFVVACITAPCQKAFIRFLSVQAQSYTVFNIRSANITRAPPDFFCFSNL